MKEVILTVKIELRHPVNLVELKSHVKMAVQAWGWGLHVDDPMFDAVRRATVKLVKP